MHSGSAVVLLLCILLLWTPTSGSSERITFLVASDTHVGAELHGMPTSALNRHAVDAMVVTVGTEWPSEVGGGKVDTPTGLVITGDLIDDGSGASHCNERWGQWESVFGLDGSDGYLPWPVFEGFGNHDGGNTSVADGECNVVRRAVQLRNEKRSQMHSSVSLSRNRLHFSWDWGDLHLVHLNLYPGSEHEYAQAWQRGSWQYPESSLDFLKSDLARHVGRSQRPVVLFFHYGFDPGWGKIWWTDHERSLFLSATAGYNIAAVFVGHTHVCLLYQWQGLDIVNSPSTVRADDRQVLAASFMVVELDTTSGVMRVAQREGEGWGPNRMLKSTKAGAAAPSKVVGCEGPRPRGDWQGLLLQADQEAHATSCVHRSDSDLLVKQELARASVA